MSLTEGHWQVSTGPPTKGTWQLTTRPPTKGTWQLSTGPPTEGHWQVLGLWLRPGLGARLWLELRYGLRPLSLTSGSQDVDGLVAFLVGALCRPAGCPRKETFWQRLELRHGLRHGLGQQ